MVILHSPSELDAMLCVELLKHIAVIKVHGVLKALHTAPPGEVIQNPSPQPSVDSVLQVSSDHVIASDATKKEIAARLRQTSQSRYFGLLSWPMASPSRKRNSDRQPALTSRPSPISWRVLLGWLVVMSVGCVAPPPLRVLPVGCAVLHGGPEGPSCDLADDRLLRLLLETPQAARISFHVDGQPLPADELRTDDKRRMYRLRVPAGASQLSVGARVGWLRTNVVTLSVRERERHEAQWLSQARLLYEEQIQPQLAESLLRQHLADSGPTEWKALALGLLARMAMEDNRAEAGGLLEQALAADREAGLLSEQARHILDKARLLREREHRVAEAEDLLREAQPLLAGQADAPAWALAERAPYLRATGELSGALRLLDQAQALAMPIADDRLEQELAAQRAMTLVMMGRVTEATELFAGTLAQVREACQRGLLLGAQGWAWNLVREAVLPEDPVWQRHDPHAPLEEALALLQHCPRPHAQAGVLTQLAAAAAAERRFAEAAQWLAKARAILARPDGQLEREWANLDGELALGRRDWAASAQAFEELALLGSMEDLDESVWRAQLGLAAATAEHDPSRALAHYSSAEEYLDRRGRALALGGERGTYLGRFQRGTSRYLDLLLKQGMVSQALAVARHARLRGLWAFGALARTSTLPPEPRRRWEDALGAYRQARREFDEAAIAAAAVPAQMQSRLASEAAQRTQQLWSSLDEALRALNLPPQPQDFGPPGEAEVMLLCHPQAHPGWHCFVWDRAGMRDFSVACMDAAHLAAFLSGPEIRDRLQRARRLRVLPFGEMRDIDVHLLPFPAEQARPLGEQMEVVYGLDLPGWSPTSELYRKTAFLLVDPEGTLPYSRWAADSMRSALQQAGWEVLQQVANVRRVGDYPGKPPDQPSLTGEQLRAQLGQVALFHYNGHADSPTSGAFGQMLRIADGPGLLLSDILTLPRVPQQVLLFGCSTGVSVQPSGGLEALGLAQAFVLRGSRWVIGAQRVVGDAAAACVAKALYAGSERGDGIAVATANPALLLSRAQAACRGVADPRDLGAFRVFVP